VGGINKTLHLLNYIDDEDYRRRILTRLNRGESHHAVARAICHSQKGEIRKRYTDGQEDQLGALGLVTNAVVLWNTIYYMQAALDHLRAPGETLNDEDIGRLSPICHGHINMLGHYSSHWQNWSVLYIPMRYTPTRAEICLRFNLPNSGNCVRSTACVTGPIPFTLSSNFRLIVSSSDSLSLA
jgi:hypothetical protein